MRLIDKLKRKLKVKTFLYKHASELLFAVGGPAGLVYFFLAPFSPIVGIISLLLYGLIIGVGGFDVLLNEEKRKFKLKALIEHIDTLQGCSQETVKEIDVEIKETQTLIENKVEVKENKRLIAVLLERQELIKQSIEEDFGEEICL